MLYEETQKHIRRIKEAFRNIDKNVGMPLSSEKVSNILNNEEQTAFLDQIAYRYSKIQDNLGKLIRLYLYLKGENTENMTMIDVLNTAEKYGMGISKEKWFELRNLRNMIVHEYESHTQRIAEAVNRIYREIDYITELLKRLKV